MSRAHSASGEPSSGHQGYVNDSYEESEEESRAQVDLVLTIGIWFRFLTWMWFCIIKPSPYVSLDQIKVFQQQDLSRSGLQHTLLNTGWLQRITLAQTNRHSACQIDGKENVFFLFQSLTKCGISLLWTPDPISTTTILLHEGNGMCLLCCLGAWTSFVSMWKKFLQIIALFL